MQQNTVSSMRSVLLCVFFYITIIGCNVIQRPVLREELANGGPLLLSDKNPYVAANLLLASETEKSEILRGFITFRGTPDAIEAKKRWSNHLSLYLYYGEAAETFILERPSKEWIIRGPEDLPGQIKALLSQRKTSGGKAPLVFRGSVQYGLSANASAAPFNTRGSIATADDNRVISQVQGSNLEEAPSGDLLHRVTFHGETLRLISSWYTGDNKNSDRIARINGLSDPNLLELGQIVRIPRYLVKQPAPLPEAELEKYKQSIR